MNVDIAQLVAQGLTLEDIKDVIAVEVAKAKAAQAAKTPTLEEIGARVAAGEVTTKDMIVIALDYVNKKIPEVAVFGEELEFTGAQLTDIAEAIDAAIEEGREQVKGLFALADIMGVDPKEVIGSQLKAAATPGSISTADAEAVLKSLRQSFKPGNF